MKLPLREAEHEALLEELGRWDGYVSSALLGVEAVRACARYGSTYERLAREWLQGVALMPMDDAVLDESVTPSPGLRSLDALHLATARLIQEDVGAFIVYDERLSEAATESGLPVLMPS